MMPRKIVAREAAGAFAKKLRKLRESRGWSQQVMADKAGLTQALISYLEAGAKEPGWETVQAIADALGVRTDELR
jgi:transcriptional regulator with XRE-family HTH domain